MKKNGYKDIARELRVRWGKNWQPGFRLPTYREVQLEFDTTPVTVQRAMNLLQDQGYIRTRPTVGSFLVKEPPYQSRIGLVFPKMPDSPTDTTWSKGYLALWESANRIDTSQEHWSFNYYLSLRKHPEASTTIKTIRRDLMDRVMAGLIFSYQPYELQREFFHQKSRIPIVNREKSTKLNGLSIIPTDRSFLHEALELLKKRKISDVAVLTRIQMPVQTILDTLKFMNISVRPEWIQATDFINSDWIPYTIASMFQQDGRKTPQALIITDDHLVEPTVNVLLGMGLPQDKMPMILGYWNFPLPYSANLPIIRIGFDANRWMRGALELIEQHADPEQEAPDVLSTCTMHVEESGPDAAPGDLLKLISKARDSLRIHAKLDDTI